MKRLIAYLFIVLGLGLTFSVSTHADYLECVSNNLKNLERIFYTSSSNKKLPKNLANLLIFIEEDLENFEKTTDLSKIKNSELYKISKKDLKTLQRAFFGTVKRKPKGVKYSINYCNPTQVAKAEPSQNIKELEKSVHEQKASETMLFNLYKNYSFDIGQIINAKTNYTKMDASKGRALLYQRILLSKTEKNKLELAYLLKKSFMDDDLENAFVFELSKILKSIKDTPSTYKSFYKYYINPYNVQSTTNEQKWIIVKPIEETKIIEQTQITKAVTSQKQKVAKNKDNFICVENDKNSNSSILQKYRLIPSVSPVIVTSNCLFKIYEKEFKNSYDKIDLKYSGIITSVSGYELSQITKKDNLFNLTSGLIELNRNYTLTKDLRIKFKSDIEIAKVEPSQTQPVKEFTKIVGEGIGSYHISTYELTSGGKPTKDTKWSLKYAEEQACLQAQKNTYKNAFTKLGVPTSNNINRFLIAAIVNKKVLSKDIDIDINEKNLKCDYSAEILVKTSELNKFATKSKKKVKIAKVEEPKQEEFKPENKDIDNDAPVIEIAQNITVDSQVYTLKGKVKDKSQIYLTIDGRRVQVKKGKFELERFNIDPDVVEEVKIVAIDKWNNKAEKTIKVTIDLKSTDTAKFYENLNPNNVKAKIDNNKIAIIIGIEKYENLTNLDAKYANRDAKAFRAYATRALGVKPSNIKMLIDDKATRSQALKAFKLWLPKISGKGGKEIHIFFAGHGLASDNGEDLFIIPQDGESSLLEDTAISRVELISLIKKVNPKSVTMFFDTCYSGQTRDERMLVASLRPLRIVADEQDTPDNFTIFTASNYDQTSGSIEEAKHGMFSYYLMKGLEGKADENKDKKITNGELIAYLQDNVSQEAFTQNREQDPMLSGDPDKVLISYR